MESFVKKLNGVHLNKVLDIQEKDFKNLPVLNEHMDERNERFVLCYR